MSKKPYIYEGFEWLEIVKKKDWNDPSVNPDDLAEYSELQKPYFSDDGKNNYPDWEWTWPDLTWPDVPPTTTDPIEHPCNIEDSCVAVGITGPTEMDCGDCFPYSHVHVVLTCDPQWWMAFGSWIVVEKNFQQGDCEISSQSPIMCTVCCTDDAQGNFHLRYEGVLECVDEIEISVDCGECCEEMELTGATTQATGTTWTGSISPACPCLTCEAVSNSGCTVGCTLNEAGSEVTVTAPDCGGVTVTVTDECVEGECEANTASATFNVTGDGGDWKLFATDGCGTGEGCGAGCNINYYAPCIQQPYKYGTGHDAWTFNNACRDNWYRQCKGCGGELPCCQGVTYGPPCSGNKSCSAGSHHYCDNSPCSEGGDCCCAVHSCWKCEWRCTC